MARNFAGCVKRFLMHNMISKRTIHTIVNALQAVHVSSITT